MWLPGSLCLPGGSQRVSSTRKAPSKVTLGTKSPPSHRSGGFVPLHRPAEPPPPPPLRRSLCFHFRELLCQPLHHGRGEVRLHAPRGVPVRREQRPQLPGEPARGGGYRRGRGLGGSGAQARPSPNRCWLCVSWGVRDKAAGCPPPRAEPAKRAWSGLSGFSDGSYKGWVPATARPLCRTNSEGELV